MSQRSGPVKKKSKAPLIIAIVVSIVILLIVIVVVIVVILLRRARAVLDGATNCNSDADCALNFKCNPSNKICSQCLSDDDCSGGRKCVGPVCLCPSPEITDATVTVVQSWPPIIEVHVDSTGGDYATNKYKIVFTNSANTYTSPSEFFANPNSGTEAPTFTFELPATCSELYSNYGCAANCGVGFTLSGKFSIQVENSCGSRSATVLVPLSGNCDLCSDTTC
jgi:hypothetical protein